MRYEIAGPAGRLEARWDDPPKDARAVAVLASPDPQQGGTFQDRVVHHVTRGLLESRCAVLRFNFRGVGTSAGTHTGGPGEQDDFRAALDAAAARYPGLPIWAAGYSFGAYVAATVGVSDDRVSLLLLVAPPVDIYDFSSIVTSPKATFLIHGERDELTPLAAIRRFYASLSEPRELVILDAANHVFDGHSSEIAETVEDLLIDFEYDPMQPNQKGGARHG